MGQGGSMSIAQESTYTTFCIWKYGFGLAYRYGVKSTITRRGSSFLMPAILIYLQPSFLTQLCLICHVMNMIYEYGLSTSQIRWSGKQVNLLDSEEFICVRYYFLSKVLYLKCWSKFSPTLTFCSDHFLLAHVIRAEQRRTMLLPTQQSLCVMVRNTSRHSFLFLA